MTDDSILYTIFIQKQKDGIIITVTSKIEDMKVICNSEELSM